MPLFGGCFSRKRKKRRKLNISAPLHLLVKGDVSLQCHAFKSKLFRRKRTCSVCHQSINTQGSSCRVCKYACHKSCEPKASGHCEEAGGGRLQNEPLAKPRQPPTKPLPGRLVAGGGLGSGPQGDTRPAAWSSTSSPSA